MEGEVEFGSIDRPDAAGKDRAEHTVVGPEQQGPVRSDAESGSFQQGVASGGG
jgi:hypothetical protein